MANRHRTDKLTTKHSIIGDYKRILLDISAFDEVDSIITGQISNNKTHHTGLSFQYMTETGIKLLAKTANSVQEVFIVTKHKQIVLDLLQGYGMLDTNLETKVDTIKSDFNQNTINKSNRNSGNWKQSNQRQARGDRVTRSNSASNKEVSAYSQKESAMSVGDHLQSATMSKLLAAKAQLEKQDHQTTTKPTATNHKLKHSSKQSASDSNDEELTMEDLFNPKDEGNSFADLLKNSKLDWRKFK